MGSGKDKKRSLGKQKKRAHTEDRYRLYLDSVQSPDNEVHFFNRAFRKAFGRPPKILREDFCGTAAVCYEWVKNKKSRRAIGVDIDPEPLAWGRENLAPRIPASALERVELLQQDVRQVGPDKADVVAAQNFSFWIFKTRDELRRYFQAARENLADEGVMVLDMMGGPEVQEEDNEETTKKKGYTYVWDQHRFDPITHDCTFYIHFRFKDGSEIRKAFEYHWRLWTIPEVQELLFDAGFDSVDVYWEGTDPKTGEGNDVFKIRKHAASDTAWIAYLVATKRR